MKSSNQHFILASKSPRRHELLKGMGFAFQIVDLDADESFPSSLPVDEIAAYISKNKALAYNANIEFPVITADTIVALNGEILGKPGNREEAVVMLQKLSGKTHQVYTGVTVRSVNTVYSFTDRTDVTFRDVSIEEIAFYIDNYHPFDKAGSYGVQDWWGLTVVHKLVGSYTNVMGLPTEKLYTYLNSL